MVMIDNTDNWVVITQAHCDHCEKVKQTLWDYDKKFSIIRCDDQGGTSMRRFMEAMDIKKVPAVFWNGTYLGGAEDTEKALEWMSEMTDQEAQQAMEDRHSFGIKLH